MRCVIRATRPESLVSEYEIFDSIIFELLQLYLELSNNMNFEFEIQSLQNISWNEAGS